MNRSAFRRWIGVELVEVSVLERLIATLGGGLSMVILLGISRLALPQASAAVVVASMGASAVLLFGVPHGPLSQPWPVIAGHAVSAVIGVACARLIPQPLLAVAFAVGLSIGAMHLLKCIHPPGGATAFTAVLGGSAIHDLGFGYVLSPVLLNAVVMVLIAFVINGAFPWRRYPAVLNRARHVPEPEANRATPEPSHAEVRAALNSLDSFVDITEEDLVRLVQWIDSRKSKRS